jgi:hypothetical protein
MTQRKSQILGIIATLKQQWETAEVHFQTALSVAGRTGAKPELARTYLDYARMLVSKGDARRAAQVGELGSRARSIFDKLGMLPFAQRTKQLMDTC